jgi:hypothetical protein
VAFIEYLERGRAEHQHRRSKSGATPRHLVNMARLGRPPLTAENMRRDAWGALLLMQDLIDEGRTPNAAAVLIGCKRWRDFSRNSDAGIQWLKRNQRKLRSELNEYRECESQSQLLRLAKRPGWTIIPTNLPLGGGQRFVVFPAELRTPLNELGRLRQTKRDRSL